ncbi:MAG TPA: hypothetical protein VJ373_05210 [Desulfatiglandales bacterium]|nr:hypothetical protein [Desulfatiglandales bacterium]
MENTLRKNERCFIGMPSCGYGYESAKLCFVACPSHEKYTLKIDVIKDIIESQQYECHIALKRIDPGTFAFCTKICSKIIQSHFCIVFLDPSFDKNGAVYPNPNVHFEYGMMISQNKHIIPLQDEQFDLAFNISPLDTIKYNDTNFKSKVTDAIIYAIKRSSETKSSGTQPPGPELFTFYSLHGFRLSDTNVNFFKLLYDFGANLGFFIFDDRKFKNYKFIGPFDYEDPKLAILHTKLLIENIISTYKNILNNNSTAKEEQKIDVGYLVNSISIDLIISPFYDKSEILERISAITNNEFDYPITIYYRNDFRDYINERYKEIGTIEPIKSKT